MVKVIVTVGDQSEECEVFDDLLTTPFADKRQDAAMFYVGKAFVEAYIKWTEEKK